MQPSFANIFNVTTNEGRTEVVLGFFQHYMNHNYTIQPKDMIDVPQKEVAEVASVILTREGATALYNALQKTLGFD